ncbi:GDP-mannose 4,6-dehydratase [uncultured Hyphomonas sp.]|jgi:GDPmannose 4,6-dehydratase|uniref:GDP-mannose 4,6-dehydratase n=1 Tax=uncultured Hyphomonas sp. TaxID=225298 RepID=UPI0030DB725A|tara:strand:- start:17356 stop:18390 length:1035 start_codon:yes stop_codon:yes gene_type:complete
MAKTALITGITGQDGAYLAKLLLEKGYEVHGGVRRIGVISTGRLDELGITDSLHLHDFELLEESNIRRVLEKSAPDEVYNLAAQSFVGVSFEQPLYTSNADALGVMRILESLRSLGGKTRFYQASTSEMFGKVQAIPQTEATPFYPRSPYGVAKLFAHWATVNYRESFDMFACSGILFNHESPLRGKEFVTRKITLAFARIAAGKQDVLELGNLNAQRDWGYAADYVEGMWRMLQQDTPDDYVLATGETHTIRSFVDAAGAYFGWEFDWQGEGENEVGIERKSGKTLVRVNPAFFRPAEVELLIGSPAKADEKLGWKREVDLNGLVQLMCEADEKRVKAGPIAF